jgi:putative SOS response-associated peptidase YedK
MCGRYTTGDPRRCIAEFSVLEKQPALEPRYNIAPSQGVWVIRILTAGSERRLDLLRWGLVRRSGMGGGLAMVRVESLATRATFAEAFRSRRCLLVADGFYEWQRAGKKSFPHYIRRRGAAPFAMAGIWQPAPPGADEAPLDSCAVITRPAAAPIDAVHDRMPAILAPQYHDSWLDPRFRDLRALGRMVEANPGFDLETLAVGPRVNSPVNDDASCICPATEDDRRGEQFELWPRGDAFRAG